VRDYQALNTLKPRLCANCGNPYQPTSGKQRFCSVGCGGKIGPYQPRERPEAEPASEPAPTPSKQMNAAKERVRLYKELLAFITEGKGWVTSEPGCSPLRFESIDARLGPT